MVLAPCWGEGFRESEGGKRKKKQKHLSHFFLSPLSSFPSFHVLFTSFFISFSLSLFHYFFSLSFFFSSLSLSISLSCLAKKNTKITEIIENTQKYQNHQKSPKITENTRKPYKNRAAKNNFCKNHETLRK